MQSKRRLLFYFLLLGMLLTLFSCHQQKIYSHYEHMPTDGWDRTDTVHFYIPAVKASGIYKGEVGVRDWIEFPYTALSLEIMMEVHPQQARKIFTVKCPLFENTGKQLGKGIGYFQDTFPFGDIELNEGDSVHVCVTHMMRREQIPGVADIGITLLRK